MSTMHRARATMFGLAHHPARYERLTGHLAGRLFTRVVADVVAAALPPGARVLDVGTGPGALPRRLAGECPGLRIDAVDLSAEMIERARRGAADAGLDGITFEVADVARLRHPDDTFDLVVSTASQHHWADPRGGMAEVGRVLRPGAQAWIYDFRWALRRAENAARAVSPELVVSRQSPLTGTSWLNPIGRLVLRTVGSDRPGNGSDQPGNVADRIDPGSARSR